MANNTKIGSLLAASLRHYSHPSREPTPDFTDPDVRWNSPATIGDIISIVQVCVDYTAREIVPMLNPDYHSQALDQFQSQFGRKLSYETYMAVLEFFEDKLACKTFVEATSSQEQSGSGEDCCVLTTNFTKWQRKRGRC